MTVENKLLKKTYYEKFMIENETNHPVQVLAENFLTEQQTELPDLSYIRFSQGEVYYHHKDFEAAIYKWEKITNELEPWAKKNIGDSYYELGMLSTSEDFYLAIESNNLILNSEVALQLFSIYIEEERLDEAAKVIKNLVELNPDYPNVTTIARSFFEEYRDWSSAIELAINEAIRTESLVWFNILKSYVNDGLTKTIEPTYFSRALITLHTIDHAEFEQFVSSLWNSYKGQEDYFSWIIEFNHLFLNVEVDRTRLWNDLSVLYQETYFDLIDGSYFIKEIADVIPNLLTNWLKVTHPSHSLVTAAAVLSWSEIFPSCISSVIVKDAENMLNHSLKYSDGLAESLQLFEAILNWAEKHEIKVGYKLKWIVQELLDLHENRLLVAGISGNGKTSFINSLFREHILEPSTSTVVHFKNNDEIIIKEISEAEMNTELTLSDFRNITAWQRQTHLVDVKLPSEFLKEHTLSLIVPQSNKGITVETNEWFTYLHVADGLLFVLDAQNPFSDEERDLLLRIQEHAPNLPIHFVLNKVDAIYNEHEVKRIVTEAKAKINNHFPNASIIAYSSFVESKRYLNGLSEQIKTIFSNGNIEEERNEKLLYFIRKTVTQLIEKRVEMENTLLENVIWNEEAVVRLNGAINQLSDLEKEKIEIIKRSYRMIKDEMKEDLTKTIPTLLRNCSDFIQEDSDFKNINNELHKEMNKRVQSYLEHTLVPKFSNAIQEWLEICNVEFIQSQSKLKEMSEGFNSLYKDERFKLDGDFRVLDDWYRDVERMTNGMRMETVNVLLRLTPSQFFLKSSGKLFGALPKNKMPVYKMYKKFIENEDYDYVADAISQQVIMPFDLFEKGLERDITMFFRNPFNVMNKEVEKAHSNIETNKDSLSIVKTNPEFYFDPLKLFEVRLRQYEWMLSVRENIRSIHSI